MTHASTVVLAYLPSPDRGVWHLGPIPIRAYALCIIAGIALAIWWGERRWVARGGQAGAVTDIAVLAVPFGLVGGRLYHVITDAWRYFGPGKNPIAALEIWDGGLGIPGAVALGAVGAWIACRRKGIPLPAMADAVAPGIVAAQAIGRIGNYFNQELYGGPTTLPWGLEIFHRVDPVTHVDDSINGIAVNHVATAIVHPTFLYELIWDLLIAGVVVLVDRRLRLGHGRAFAVYVGGYAVGRFWIELMRSDDATRIFGVRVNVWMMTFLFVGAVIYFVLARAKGDREEPALLAAHSTAEHPGPDSSADSADSTASAHDSDDKGDRVVTPAASDTRVSDTGGDDPLPDEDG